MYGDKFIIFFINNTSYLNKKPTKLAQKYRTLSTDQKLCNNYIYGRLINK